MRPMFRSTPSAPKVSSDLRVRPDPAVPDLSLSGSAGVPDPQTTCCWVIVHPNGAPYGRTRTWLGRPRRERHYRTKKAAVAAIWRMGPDAIAVARAGQLSTPCEHHTRADRTLLAG